MSKHHLPVKCDSVEFPISFIYLTTPSNTWHQHECWDIDCSVLGIIGTLRISPRLRVHWWHLLILQGCLHWFRGGRDSGEFKTQEIQIQWTKQVELLLLFKRQSLVDIMFISQNCPFVRVPDLAASDLPQHICPQQRLQWNILSRVWGVSWHWPHPRHPRQWRWFWW